MKKQGLSIKYKLLLLLATLPTVMLALYLVLAMNIFKSDKIAYVYDSSSAVAKILSAQVRAEVDSSLASLKLVGESSTTQSEELFNKDQDFYYFANYQSNGSKGLIKIRELTKTNKESIQAKSLDRLLLALIKGTKPSGLTVMRLGKKNSLTLFVKAETDGTGFPSYFVMVRDTPALYRAFEKSSAYSNFLTDGFGNLIAGPDLSQTNQSFAHWTFFKKSKAKNLPILTSEVEEPRTHRKLLLSLSKVGVGDFSVVSFVETKKALQATDVLLWKSILFFIALISLSVVISVFASRRFTIAIRDLYAATLRVAQGHFDIEVKVDSNDEIEGLADSFNQMTLDLKTTHEKLQDYAKNLEIKVEERTRELAKTNSTLDAMVNSLGQGFLVFTKEGTCAQLFSKACLDLLEGNPALKPVWNVLRVESTKVADFKNWCSMLFDEPLPFSDLIGLAPKTFPHSQNRHITLEYFPIRGEDSKIAGVVLVATDKTAELEATLLAKKEATLSKRVIRITKNKNQFQNFVHGARKIITEVENQLNAKSFDDAKIDFIFRLVHTLKGDSGTFLLDFMVEKVHKFEEEIQNLKTATPEVRLKAIPNFQKYTAEIRELFEQFLTENKDIVGNTQNMEKSLDIPLSRITQFFDKMKAQEIYKELSVDFEESFLKEPIQKFFDHYADLAADLSVKKEKKLEPLTFKGGDLRIWAAPYADLFSTFVHAVRNSVDHGIEIPAERSKAGKKAAGGIVIAFKNHLSKDNQPWLDIEFQDDGKGIDPKAIRKKLEKNGNQTASVEPDEKVIYHIFDNGFSTNETANELSGRGVGMGAIKAEAEKLGGTVELVSEVGKGTRVIVSVPQKNVA